MNITLLVEWSASDAMPPGTLATEFHTDTLQFGYELICILNLHN